MDDATLLAVAADEGLVDEGLEDEGLEEEGLEEEGLEVVLGPVGSG